jgi:hypothetical protein
MDEALISRVTDAILQRLAAQSPRALLIGETPQDACEFLLVQEKPYDAVVIGSLTLSQQLQPPPEAALEALLEGKPVYVAGSGLASNRYSKTRNRILWSELQAAERRWRQLGIQPLPAANAAALITAETARALRAAGRNVPKGARCTPLARDILEGKSE